ncbi:glycosyltransferase family A protein [Olleya marilimosa]|uniref:glycosyltransferase family A protein n=1 Tax=Olleya marilimosa TaxID=272164 RepID=UPI000487BFA3|nr:glycosyltransferase family A protein [Olleya marilimosa]
MGNAKKKDVKLELLISTMFQTSLDFLSNMFPNSSSQNYNILIINQTDQSHLLKSTVDNIRVINSFEKGLAKSRNMAINNTIGQLCLIVDDDVKFKPDFDKIILEAYNKNPNAAIITFKMEDFDGNLFKNYPLVKFHNLESIKEVNSVVITFNTKLIKQNRLLFNVNFGLGSTFETADEYIFMREALKLKMQTIFEPKVILSHPFFSSGKDSGNDKLVYARSALYYKYSGVLGYLKLCKYLYIVHKQGAIKTNQIIKKFKVGLKGIDTYKNLVKLGIEKA